MKLTQFSINNPYSMISIVLVVIVLGFFAFWRTPTDLFPDTSPPQVSVVTVYPGADSFEIVDKITWLLEKEINTLPGLTAIKSVSRDEVSSILAEFSYDKPVGECILDVQNAVARVQGNLPQGITPPRIYRITDATRPLLTLSLTPHKGSLKSLADIRLLAENDIKNTFLAIPGVGDVQVFGGHQPEVEVSVDRDALTAHNLNLKEVISCLAAQNVSAPAGTIYGRKKEYLIQVNGEFKNIRELSDMPLTSASDKLVYLHDIATVSLSEADPRSFYHGNGKPAIAMNIMRSDGGNTMGIIHNIKSMLPDIKRQFPDIDFAVTNDQQPIIDLNIHGMRSSLLQAIILTMIVIFFFLANIRSAVAVSVSIPLSFLAALAVIWFSPFTLNMVTLSALIISVGMVVDASIVVIENINRHFHTMDNPDPYRATLIGTSEIALPITAGMLTTVTVLIPVMFTHDFTGRIMFPLNMIIITTLIASLLVSLTVIPIVASKLLKKGSHKKQFLERLFMPVDRGIGYLIEVYVKLIRWSLNHRLIFIIMALIFLVSTMKFVKPLIGGEEMPPMDTGIVTIDFDTDSGTKPENVEAILSQVEEKISHTPGVLTISSTIGSEPEAISFGTGFATAQSARMTIRLVDRMHRDDDIWQIQKVWRDKLRAIPGIRSYRVSEYGATPVSTTKAPLDVIISGPDTAILDQLADEAISHLSRIPGIVDLRRSWYADKPKESVSVDQNLARLYDTSSAEIGETLRTAIHGNRTNALRLADFLDIPIRVRYKTDQLTEPESLGEVKIPTRLGPVALRSMATMNRLMAPPFVTRENLKNTIDLTAGNQVMTIAQIGALAEKQLQKMKLPAGYHIEVAGSAADLAEGQKEMGRALLIGLIFLYLLLMSIFKSPLHPISVMAAIPFAVAGAFWGLLIFDKPFCKPAFMGIILLGGTIVNNAILMLDFIIRKRKDGIPMEESIIQSVQLRLRPILMTAASTIIGFTPLIFEMAVGLERMSPLGIVAGAGLLIGTVVTTVVSPVIYSLVDSIQWRKILHFQKQRKDLALSLLIPFVLISMLSASHCLAEEMINSPLSMDTAIRFALKNNPDLQSAQADIKRLESIERAIQAGKKPQVDMLASGILSQEKHGMVPQLISNKQRFDDKIFQAGINARYLLFDFNRIDAQISMAASNLKAGMAVYDRRQQEIIFNVSRLFLSTLTVQDLLKVANASYRNLTSLAETTDNLFSAGRIPHLDTLKVQVRLAQVESDIADLKAQKIKLKAALTNLMGYDMDLPELRYSIPETAKSLRFSNENIVQAFSRRPDMKAAEAGMSAADSGIHAAKKALLPKIEAFGTYRWYGANDPVPALPGGQSDKWEDDASIGIQVSWSVFDGGILRSRLEQAIEKEKMARAELERERLTVRQEILSADADLDSALAQIESSIKAVSYAREALRVEKIKYASGKGIINDVLDAESSYLEACSLEQVARRKSEIAQLSLSLALGELDFKNIRRKH